MVEPRVREEVILPFPAPRDAIPRATAYRSTWIVSSLGSLFCEKSYIHDLPGRRRGEAIFKLQWA